MKWWKTATGTATAAVSRKMPPGSASRPDSWLPRRAPRPISTRPRTAAAAPTQAANLRYGSPASPADTNAGRAKTSTSLAVITSRGSDILVSRSSRAVTLSLLSRDATQGRRADRPTR